MMNKLFFILLSSVIWLTTGDAIAADQNAILGLNNQGKTLQKDMSGTVKKAKDASATEQKDPDKKSAEKKPAVKQEGMASGSCKFGRCGDSGMEGKK